MALLKGFKINDGQTAFSDVMLLLSLLLVGGFNEYLSCVISIALLIGLLLIVRKNRRFIITANWQSAAVALLVVCYGLTVFWAVDSGMAFMGFLKFLPILLYLSILQQSERTDRVIHALPYYVAALTAVTAIASLIPYIQDWFLVAGRFAGAFQYPNTFALLILVAELLLFKKTNWKWAEYITAAVLVGGLLYTGSRAVFLLALASNFVMILTRFSGKRRWCVLGVAAVAVAAVLCVALFGPEGNMLSRLLEIGLTQSTFAGRFLYMQDALPLLLKHPFGMGYFGYFYAQGAVQTGVYNVSFVHNDFLQMALDVGILPALLFAASVVRYFCKRTVSFADKIVVAVFTLHNLFDFNLQFVGMFMLYLLLTQDTDGKQITITNPAPLKVVLPLLAAVNLYMAIPLTLSHFSAYEAAHTLYPYNTRNTYLLLGQQTDVNRAHEIAQAILTYNTEGYAPYSIGAKYAYAQGDFRSVMAYKNEVFSRNRFGYPEYEEYGMMLANGIVAYERQGDSASADVLKAELKALQNRLQSLNGEISALGNMVDDYPVTTLPDEVLQYIDYSYVEGGGSH